MAEAPESSPWLVGGWAGETRLTRVSVSKVPPPGCGHQALCPIPCTSHITVPGDATVGGDHVYMSSRGRGPTGGLVTLEVEDAMAPGEALGAR